MLAPSNACRSGGVGLRSRDAPPREQPVRMAWRTGCDDRQAHPSPRTTRKAVSPVERRAGEQNASTVPDVQSARTDRPAPRTYGTPPSQRENPRPPDGQSFPVGLLETHKREVSSIPSQVSAWADAQAWPLLPRSFDSISRDRHHPCGSKSRQTTRSISARA